MPYPCTWPMLFLVTVHLSFSPDTRVLFNSNFFLHLVILSLPADDMTGSTQVHRLPQGSCSAEQCHLYVLSPGQENPKATVIPSRAQ